MDEIKWETDFASGGISTQLQKQIGSLDVCFGVQCFFNWGVRKHVLRVFTDFNGTKLVQVKYECELDDFGDLDLQVERMIEKIIPRIKREMKKLQPRLF